MDQRTCEACLLYNLATSFWTAINITPFCVCLTCASGHSLYSAPQKIQLHCIRKLPFLLQTSEDSGVAALYPMALSLCGSWLGETRSKSPSEIIECYLEKSVALMEEQCLSGKEAMMDAYLTLARYTDNQYRRVERHMESSAFEAKRSLLKKNKVSSHSVDLFTICFTRFLYFLDHFFDHWHVGDKCLSFSGGVSETVI